MTEVFRREHCCVFDLVYLGLVVSLQRNPNGLTSAQMPVTVSAGAAN